MSDNKVCPYCKGRGFIDTGFKEVVQKGHRTLYPYTEPCYCSINRNLNKKFGMLSGTNDAHPYDAKLVYDFFNKKKRNCLMFGKESLFLYIVKCFMLSGFTSKNYMLLEGGTIVSGYNTPRPNKEWLSTHFLNQFDLLVILFTTEVNYPTLKECVIEVIKNRSRLDVSTWVYHSSPNGYKEAKDYSSGLDKYLDEYREISLSVLEPKLIGYDAEDSEMVKKKNAEKANEIAGQA